MNEDANFDRFTIQNDRCLYSSEIDMAIEKLVSKDEDYKKEKARSR